MFRFFFLSRFVSFLAFASFNFLRFSHLWFISKGSAMVFSVRFISIAFSFALANSGFSFILIFRCVCICCVSLHFNLQHSRPLFFLLFLRDWRVLLSYSHFIIPVRSPFLCNHKYNILLLLYCLVLREGNFS